MCTVCECCVVVIDMVTNVWSTGMGTGTWDCAIVNKRANINPIIRDASLPTGLQILWVWYL